MQGARGRGASSEQQHGFAPAEGTLSREQTSLQMDDSIGSSWSFCTAQHTVRMRSSSSGGSGGPL